MFQPSSELASVTVKRRRRNRAGDWIDGQDGRGVDDVRLLGGHREARPQLVFAFTWYERVELGAVELAFRVTFAATSLNTRSPKTSGTKCTLA